MDNDFWSGVRLAVNGLADAAKKASYCLGFGAGGFGIALVVLAKLAIGGPPALLIALSAFFILARLGKAVDDRLELTSNKSLPPEKWLETHLSHLHSRLISLEERQVQEVATLRRDIQQSNKDIQPKT